MARRSVDGEGDTPDTQENLKASRLHSRTRAGEWGVSVQDFARVLDASAKRIAGESADAGEIERAVNALHVEDLALAMACARGNEIAWEHFVKEHRQSLYRAADAIDPTGGTRELADSLYADLYGLRERDGERQSLFRYYQGRSALGTWLRAVLSQRHVDRLRATRRIEPLPEEESPRAIQAQDRPIHPRRDQFLAMMRTALAAAVAALEPRDRMRLAFYYVQNLTLAEIGRVMREHEATASRHLAQTRRHIREDVERRLRDDHGLSEDAVSECFESVASDAGSLDIADMLGSPAGQPLRKNGVEDRSKRGGGRRVQ